MGFFTWINTKMDEMLKVKATNEGLTEKDYEETFPCCGTREKGAKLEAPLTGEPGKRCC